MSEHAILPCSASDEWGNCGGWLALNAGLEVEETDEMRWGTECHEYSEKWLGGCLKADRRPPPTDDVEMLETARMYVEHCDSLMVLHSVFNPLIECKVDPGINPNVWGTGDFAFYSPNKKRVVVRDFKTGRKLVEPDSDQLKLYAMGVMEHYELQDTDVYVDLGVVQPRGYHKNGPIRSKIIPAIELRADRTRLMAKAEENISGVGKLQSGEHCLNCNARFRCPAAQEYSQSIATAPVINEPSAAELGVLITHIEKSIKFLEKMKSSYSGVLEGKINDNEQVPGWALVPTYARSEKWTKPLEEIKTLGSLFGKKLTKEELITPAQAVKLGIPREVINYYCTKNKTGVKLSRTDPSEIANIFKGDKK